MTVPRESIADAVRMVLDSAATGKGNERHYLTAYQILERIPEAIRVALVAEYGALAWLRAPKRVPSDVSRDMYCAEGVLCKMECRNEWGVHAA